MARTNVYIDAFNLYYGALRKTPHRWLDLAKLCQLMLPPNQIQQIKYFTALVKPRPNNPEKPVRQQMYLRALGTIPNVSVILGHYLSHEVMMPLASPPATGQKYVKVVKTEEKGSDVNLATHLLSDGYENNYDIAVIISNDSDLAGPLEIVANRLKKVVGVLNPHDHHPSRELIKHATFFKQIRAGVLPKCQFPSILTDAHGTFHKPEVW